MMTVRRSVRCTPLHVRKAKARLASDVDERLTCPRERALSSFTPRSRRFHEWGRLQISHFVPYGIEFWPEFAYKPSNPNRR